MSILSGLFDTGGDSDNDNSGDLLGTLDSALSINDSHTSYNQTTDQDGSSHTSYDQNTFGTNLDTSGMLHNMFNDMGHADGGSLFG